jgi:ABC-type multidrug transport system ATPase subunit
MKNPPPIQRLTVRAYLRFVAKIKGVAQAVWPKKSAA